MLKRPFKSVIARIAIVALALSLVFPFIPAAFADSHSTSVPYAENGTGPVATFTATDQDGDAIEWSRSGADKDLFTITNGVLAFKKSPDYEKPTSKSTGTLADRNVYNVTLEAAGGSHDVVVTVTNVDEDGKVTINKPQPQVGRGLEATLTDPDNGVTDERWQWARSSDGETWTDIAGATAQSRSPVDADEGMYLRASVTYEDSFGAGKTQNAVTANAVEAKTVSNAAPSFADQDEIESTRTYVDVTRSVGENSAVGTNVGKPVSASDADNDVLIYSLEDTPDLKDGDNARFTIDSSSGQIKMGQKLGGDINTTTPADSEAKDETTTDVQVGFTSGATLPTALTTAIVENNSMYVLRVKATDPSGASAIVNVIVTVTELPEAPEFDEDAPTTLWVTEGVPASLRTGMTDVETGAGANRLSDAPTTFVATDDDGETVTYELVEPADENHFNLTTDAAVLTITSTPDYEKRSSYSITIVAKSGDDDDARSTRLAVTVKVTDAEDTGEIVFTQREPQVGRAIVASVDDPDGGETISRWQWYRDDDGTVALSDIPDSSALGVALCTPDTSSFPCAIDGATSASYVPTEDDYDDASSAGRFLVAMATYTDNIEGDAAPTADTRNDDNDGTTDANADGISIIGVTERGVQLSNPANAAPKFPDQDPNAEGDQSETASRSVAENTKEDQPIGAAVSATDTNTDLLLYTLGGTDAGSFGIDKKTGQLKTKAKLDFETKATYTVVVTATDPSGATDSIMVTINVTDVDDDATITLVTEEPEPENNAPAFAGESVTLTVPENSAGGANVGDPVTATDADEGDEVSYSLSDSGTFQIDAESGQISVAEGASLDYETQRSYTVTVTASDGTDSATIEVTINVGNVGLANAYDTDDSGDISKAEAVNAVQDYFDDEISRDDVLAVIRLYFG